MSLTRLHTVAIGAAAIAAVAVPALWSHDADAGNSIRHHGSECFEMGYETGAFNRSEYRITRTGAGGSGKLICPFNVNRESGWARALVNVNDRHDSAEIVCSLQARTDDGNMNTYDSQTTLGSPGKHSLELEIGHHGMDTKILVCDLPANAGSNYTKLYNYTAIQL